MRTVKNSLNAETRRLAKPLLPLSLRLGVTISQLTIIAVLLPLCGEAQTAEDFFHRGAQYYIWNQKQKATNEIFTGLRLFPADPQLNHLAELLKKEEEQKKQQQQQKDQQNEQSQKDQNQQQQQEQQNQSEQKQDSSQPAQQKKEEQPK